MNPALVLFAVAWGLSPFLLAGSLTPFAIPPAFAFLIDLNFIRAEERMLQHKFGERWVKYRREVRRWI